MKKWYFQLTTLQSVLLHIGSNLLIWVGIPLLSELWLDFFLFLWLAAFVVEIIFIVFAGQKSEQDVRIVKQYSLAYRQIAAINKKYSFSSFEKCKNLTIKCSTLKQFKDFRLEKYLEKDMKSNFSPWKKIYDRLTYNTTFYGQYVDEYSALKNCSALEDIGDIPHNISARRFQAIERSLYNKEKQKKPTMSFEIKAAVSYTSPAGKNYYQKEERFQQSQFERLVVDFQERKGDFFERESPYEIFAPVPKLGKRAGKKQVVPKKGATVLVNGRKKTEVTGEKTQKEPDVFSVDELSEEERNLILSMRKGKQKSVQATQVSQSVQAAKPISAPQKLTSLYEIVSTEATGRCPIRQVGGTNVISNTLFAFTYERILQSEETQPYVLFFVSQKGEVISDKQTLENVAVGEQKKLSFELLPKYNYQDDENYYLIIQQAEKNISKIPYQIKIAFVAEFDF